MRSKYFQIIFRIFTKKFINSTFNIVICEIVKIEFCLNFISQYASKFYLLKTFCYENNQTMKKCENKFRLKKYANKFR